VLSYTRRGKVLLSRVALFLSSTGLQRMTHPNHRPMNSTKYASSLPRAKSLTSKMSRSILEGLRSSSYPHGTLQGSPNRIIVPHSFLKNNYQDTPSSFILASFVRSSFDLLFLLKNPLEYCVAPSSLPAYHSPLITSHFSRFTSLFDPHSISRTEFSRFSLFSPLSRSLYRISMRDNLP